MSVHSSISQYIPVYLYICIFTERNKGVFERLLTGDTAVACGPEQWVGGGAAIAHREELLEGDREGGREGREGGREGGGKEKGRDGGWEKRTGMEKKKKEEKGEEGTP